MKSNTTIPIESIDRKVRSFESSFRETLKEYLAPQLALDINVDFSNRYFKRTADLYKVDSLDWNIEYVDRLIGFFMSSITEALKKNLSPELALKIQGDFFTRLFSADKLAVEEVSNETKEKA